MKEQKWTKKQAKEHGWREQQKDIRRMDIYKNRRLKQRWPEKRDD
jgi:hypothetical protein